MKLAFLGKGDFRLLGKFAAMAVCLIVIIGRIQISPTQPQSLFFEQLHSRNQLRHPITVSDVLLPERILQQLFL
jgi:hypothetical protein